MLISTTHGGHMAADKTWTFPCCPTSENDWKVDWWAILKRFPELHPLGTILELVHQQEWVPAYWEFYMSAWAAGWRHQHIISQLSEAIADVHGPEYRDEVIKRLEEFARMLQAYPSTLSHTTST